MNHWIRIVFKKFDGRIWIFNLNIELVLKYFQTIWIIKISVIYKAFIIPKIRILNLYKI